jgi:hypothetical protein
MKGKAPSKAERGYHDRLANVVGCIACRKDGRVNHHVSIHHIEGRTRPGCHMRVLPLCFYHHMPNGEGIESVHGNKARFEAKYGKQSELQAECNRILDREVVA